MPACCLKNGWAGENESKIYSELAQGLVYVHWALKWICKAVNHVAKGASFWEMQNPKWLVTQNGEDQMPTHRHPNSDMPHWLLQHL